MGVSFVSKVMLAIELFHAASSRIVIARATRLDVQMTIVCGCGLLQKIWKRQRRQLLLQS